jgi:hypothetical protein
VPEEILESLESEVSGPTIQGLGDPRTAFGVETGRVDALTERRARHDLRQQIAQLERRLAEMFASAFPRRGIEWTVGAVGGPRVLGVAELERVRDALAVRLHEAQAELERRGQVEEQNRGLVEAMAADPQRYRWVRVSNEDVGEPGCRHWHSRPRWGIIGMLMGWWRVKLSSGCPLAGGLRPLRSSRRLDEQEASQAAPTGRDRRGISRSTAGERGARRLAAPAPTYG